MPKKKEDTKESKVVYDKEEVVREFSQELHGDTFAELAETFATKYGYTVR